jgi:hypothetical protein
MCYSGEKKTYQIRLPLGELYFNTMRNIECQKNSSQMAESSVIIGFEPFWSQCTKAFRQTICASYSDPNSWEHWSFTEVPDCPQTQASNILRVQEMEPRYYCISKYLVNDPPLRFPVGVPMERVAHFQSLLLCIS